MTGCDAVIALGNPFRMDDGVGPMLLDRLGDRELPDVELVDLGDPGFRLIHVLGDYSSVVIVDAVDFGAEPGTFEVFDPADTGTTPAERSSHRTDVFELLEVADAVEGPTTVRVFGVQPESVDFGDELTDEVAAALPPATDALVEAIEGL
ncbi:hydrogenase maturation protease [Halapricum desulfuricans]|uniref:Ni,Fe-hydrogenase maturation factor n=1 Tax=Halapricum desulfuricans TaxID=2841257 RepID=A0A897NJ36_9EURY|nr:hydrogenase maturation protease [Halapricum desulfuricans]QSG10306.1 Ni,Fe-hydrogenase maturation factor [Halapricum desulfuricans]